MSLREVVATVKKNDVSHSQRSETTMYIAVAKLKKVQYVLRSAVLVITSRNQGTKRRHTIQQHPPIDKSRISGCEEENLTHIPACGPDELDFLPKSQQEIIQLGEEQLIPNTLLIEKAVLVYNS